MERSSGILMHMSSLPSPYGIGTMGRCAYEFVDFLARSGQKYWQLLPLGPTSIGNSPYSAYSSFAGNPYLIDLELLVDEGLLNKEELEEIDWGDNAQRVDFGKISQHKDRVLRLAYSRRGVEHIAEAVEFRGENREWLDNYALYMALKKHFENKNWMDWPEDIRKRWPNAMDYYGRLLWEEMDYQFFQQYIFFKQWKKLRAYAAEKNIKFIGDIPFYVALDSADVWSEPYFFQLDSENRPVEISGVPPDAFSEEGQLWGNPLYDFDAMARDGYGWWIRRIGGVEKLYDMIRIDHFRAFESYWAVPADSSTAKSGKWRPAPGMDLLGRLTGWFKDLKFIAEDLGIITPAVRKLLDDSKLPGMKVLQFAFDANWESNYIPHRAVENSVCFVGTHDNDTVKGWIKTEKPENIAFAKKYMNISDEEGWCWGMIRTGMATVSHLFVVQMQDVLELDTDCRMNIPGTPDANWGWRMLPDAIDEKLEEKLAAYTKMFGRFNYPPKAKVGAEEEEEKSEE